MFIDSHQHFWNYNEKDYGWMGDDHHAIRRTFLPDDLLPLLSSIGFSGSVAVQARQTLEETEWLLQLAERHPFIKGVVGWVDLCSDEVELQLEKFHNNPLLKGVRHVIHDEADDDFMLRDDFVRGLGKLRQYGLTFDLLLFPKHLPNAVKLVEMFPDQPFVLDHIAKPDIKQQKMSPWSEDIHRLASYDHVYCKLSGMVTEANWQHWKTGDFTPYLDVVLDAFSTERVMIGSDWPVCTLSGDYRSVMNIVIDYARALGKEATEKILGQNCIQFYNLSTI